MLSLFEKLTNVRIDTCDNRFKFNLLAFLDVISNASREIRHEIKVHKRKDVTEPTVSEYSLNGWNIRVWI